MALIVDAKMPMNCCECPMGKNYAVRDEERRTYCSILNLSNGSFTDKRPRWCPILGEIPDYHEDLISKRALEVQIAHAFHGDMFPDISAGLALNKVMNIITDAPVIVEANNG